MKTPPPTDSPQPPSVMEAVIEHEPNKASDDCQKEVETQAVETDDEWANLFTPYERKEPMLEDVTAFCWPEDPPCLETNPKSDSTTKYAPVLTVTPVRTTKTQVTLPLYILKKRTAFVHNMIQQHQFDIKNIFLVIDSDTIGFVVETSAFIVHLVKDVNCEQCLRLNASQIKAMHHYMKSFPYDEKTTVALDISSEISLLCSEESQLTLKKNKEGTVKVDPYEHGTPPDYRYNKAESTIYYPRQFLLHLKMYPESTYLNITKDYLCHFSDYADKEARSEERRVGKEC